MRYKKEYNIKGKIISKSDITNMVNNILEKYPQKDFKMKIEAQFSDGTTITDDKVSIFDSIYFEKKLLKRVRIFINRYIDYKVDDMVDITIYKDKNFSDAVIESTDNRLYNSLCHSIEENLNLMKNQNKIYLLPESSWSGFVIVTIFLIMELIVAFILEKVLKLQLPTILIYLMILLLPNIVTPFVIKYIEKRYPINQFDFGKSSVNKPQKENGHIYKIIIFIITNIVLPIIITLLTKNL